MDLLALLRARDAISVDELASELGVGRRTVLRDLRTLRERGEPILGQAGKGGGVQLTRDRGLTAVHLAEDQLVALWLTARLAAIGSTLPWSRAARSGLDRMLASVPRERARRVRALSARVIVERPASPSMAAGSAPPDGEVLSAVERGFSSGLCLAFEYEDRQGRRSTRIAEPHGLLVHAPVWYLLALDVHREAARSFRLDRMRRARVCNDRPFRPDLARLRELHEAQRAPG